MKKIVFVQAAMLMLFGLVQMVSGQNAPAFSTIGRHKVQVNDPSLGQKMAAGGARLIADYGGYQLYDAPASMTNFPPDKAELRDEYNSILLNASRLDTTTAEVKALRKTVGGFTGKRMHLVQFAGPVQPDWRQSLEDAGAEIVSYIPQNAYLIYGDAPAIARVQALAAATPTVQWEGAYLDDYKIHPLARPGTVKIDQFSIQLVFDVAANADTLKLINQLKLAPLQRQRRVLDFVNIVVRVPPANLAQIAARPDVISIQPYGTPRKLCERQDQIVAGNLSGNIPSGPGYLAWLQNHGFDQSQFGSFSVDVSDSGIDDGTTHPNHFGLYVDGIINSTNSRVIYNRLEGTANPGSTLVGCDGHGNINAHIVAGYDNSSGFPFEDSSGFHYGLGVCPFVSLGSSVIFDPTNWTNPNFEDLMSHAYGDGVRISNNSWGDSGGGDSTPDEDGMYNSDSQEYDTLVRDAQPTVTGNQEMVIVFAAGNDGPGTGTVSPPGTAKNVITVGAAEGVQAFGGADGGSDMGGVTDSQADDANAIISFSGMGPCADGREKPDLVAPGTHISGGAPQAANPGPDGTAEPCFIDIGTNEIGVDGGSDGSIFFPDTGQQFYTASSGTSHSTPCVSGGCALLRQYFINQGLTPPSPALTKAWLMNSARYLTGAYADDTLWSPDQGMGEMNLGTAFDGTPRFAQDEATSNLFTASGQKRVFTGTVASSSEPFRVTVAWTDAPGSTTAAAAYNNNLDLTVTVGGKTYLGNNFNGAYSITGGAADLVNNVESVFLPAGVSGAYTVTIAATSINSVGVPSPGAKANQDFALVIYNSGTMSAPVAAGAIVTLGSCGNDTINPGQSATVDLIIRNDGSASTTNLVATLLFSNGVAFPSGPQTYGSLAPGAAATNAFSFTADGNCGGAVTATLQLQDGSADMGTISYEFQLGQPAGTNIFAENFSESNLTLPNLPAGWSTSDTANAVSWTTVSNTGGSLSNAAFCPDYAHIDEIFLISPSITLPNGLSQLSFRQSYDLEDTYDGGVLQIKIGGGTFQDIVAAGGSFVTNGYVEALSETNDYPACQNTNLLDQNVWSGDSDGFITTIVTLPASAEGQAIQLQWACGTDCENQGTWNGWWINNILITGTNWSCCPPTNSSVPVILLPTNGYITAVASVQIAGTAMANESFTLYNNGKSNQSITSDASGIFNTQATLPPGTNVLFLTNSGSTNASASVTVVFLPVVPTLDVASVSTTNVSVSGSGVAGAVVNIMTNGVLVAQFTNNASGAYAGTIILPVGTYSLSADETAAGLTSPASAATSVIVSTVLPVIGPQPQSLNGFLKEKVIISAGVSGATPLHIWWEKNGTKISGATTTNLTLSSLVASDNYASYVMFASNSYGWTKSQPAVLTLVTNPFPNLTGTYYGLFQETNAQFESSGFLKLTLGSLGAFSGSILNAGGSYSFSGSFSSAGHSVVSVSRGSKEEPLILNMFLDVSNGTEQISSVNSYVSNISWLAPLQADRATFSSSQNPFRADGKYTMSFGNSSDGSESPGGNGYGTVSISTAGMVSWSGVLADNTSVAPGEVSISKFGQWPLYIPLYGKLGSLSGWININTATASTFAGAADWFRVGVDGKLYKAGFTNALSLAGSPFTAGSSKIPVLDTNSFVLTLSGGGLGTNNLTNALTLYDTGKFETNNGDISKLTLSVTPGTGVISGSFLDPLTGLKATIKGVVLQEQTNASGFFVSTNATGSFLLTAP